MGTAGHEEALCLKTWGFSTVGQRWDSPSAGGRAVVVLTQATF